MSDREAVAGSDGVGAQRLPQLSEANARSALVAASATVRVDPAGAELIRLGDGAVFRLAAAPIVARVARSADRLASAEREVGVARWLASESVPAVRALDVDQPVVAEGRVVVFWESANDLEAYGTAPEVGGLLRQLHKLTAPDSLRLPPVDPFGRTKQRIDQAGGVSDEDRAFLRQRYGQLVEAFNGLTFVLPPGVVHGDASVGNVIRDRDGQPLFADLDGFAVGPREWDLVLTALYYERMGWHTAEEYAGFVEAYGFDVMTWSGYSVLADVREFLMVTWLSQNAAGDPNVAAELARRIDDLRAGRVRKEWRPF
jgi:aminoglycoside phosphotransferase